MSTVEDLVCKHCGKPAKDAIYRMVEVTGVGWAEVKLKIEDDDSINGTVDDRVQEVEWDHHARNEQNWGCSNCMNESRDLADLVEISDKATDSIRQMQKHPPEGQQKLIT